MKKEKEGEKEKWVNNADTEIMDWFYETVKISFGVDMVQDSTNLREILYRLYEGK